MAQNPFGKNGRSPVDLGATPPVVGVPAWEKTASRATPKLRTTNGLRIRREIKR